MVTGDLVFLFDRDLMRVKDELRSYNDPQLIWVLQNGISNSAGNLVLHIEGNLKHFVGAILGNTGYVRNRVDEFSKKNIPLEVLINGLNETNEVVKNCLSKLSLADLEEIFPVQVFGYDMTTRFFLIHLLSHLNYHLGQINYHRRMIG
jgi:uncharacterized damage-inducible protein DinB